MLNEEAVCVPKEFLTARYVFVLAVITSSFSMFLYLTHRPSRALTKYRSTGTVLYSVQ
jgi:hypothetical protein